MITTGIFPPDIGGPATHAADLAAELRARGHDVSVLSACDGPRVVRRSGLIRFPRRWPWPVRTIAAFAWLLKRRRHYDVVYATGLHLPAVAGARLARRPVVVKVVGDLAWERSRRLRLTDASFSTFQAATVSSPRVQAMRAVRAWTVRQATAVVTPSSYLREVVQGWAPGTDVTVVPNGVRIPERGASTERVPRSASTLHLVFVGRLVAHKRVELLLEAVAGTRGVMLTIVGDGPELRSLEHLVREHRIEDRVSFSGPLSHKSVMARLAAADALVSATSYEGLPHVVIEALTCGTPVVATPAGGVVEAIVDGTNGLLVEDAGPSAFVRAFERLRNDAALRESLAKGALEAGRTWGFDRCVDQIESLLVGLRRVEVGPPPAGHRSAPESAAIPPPGR